MSNKIWFFLNQAHAQYQATLRELNLEKSDVVDLGLSYDESKQEFSFEVPNGDSDDIIYVRYNFSGLEGKRPSIVGSALAFSPAQASEENSNHSLSKKISFKVSQQLIVSQHFSDISKTIYSCINNFCRRSFQPHDDLEQKKQKYLEALFQYFNVVDWIPSSQSLISQRLAYQAIQFLQHACQDNSNVLRIHQNETIYAISESNKKTRSFVIATRFLMRFQEVYRVLRQEYMQRTQDKSQTNIYYKALEGEHAKEEISFSYKAGNAILSQKLPNYNFDYSEESRIFNVHNNPYTGKSTAEEMYNQYCVEDCNNNSIFVYFTQDKSKSAETLSKHALAFVENAIKNHLLDSYNFIKMLRFFEVCYPQLRKMIIDFRAKFNITGRNVCTELTYSSDITAVSLEIPALKKLGELHYYEYAHNFFGTPARTEYLIFENKPKNYEELNKNFSDGIHKQDEYMERLQHYFTAEHHAAHYHENFSKEVMSFVEGIINDVTNFCRKQELHGFTSDFELILNFFKENFADVTLSNSPPKNSSMEVNNINLCKFIDDFIKNTQTKNPNILFFQNRALWIFHNTLGSLFAKNEPAPVPNETSIEVHTRNTETGFNFFPDFNFASFFSNKEEAQKPVHPNNDIELTNKKPT